MADRRSYAGMNFKQDMPPPGGYQEVMWQRTFPKTWANAKRLFAIFLGINFYGYFQYLSFKKTRNTKYLDDADVRAAYQPFLKSERDRRMLKMVRRNRELEDEVMSGVPGWKTGTWYGEPTYFTLGDGWFDLWREEVWAHGDKAIYDRNVWFSEHPEYCAPKWYDKYLPQWILDRSY